MTVIFKESKLSRLIAGFFLHFLFILSASATPSSKQLSDISKDPQWLAILHYQENNIFSGHQSFIDSSEFFLASDGATDSLHELQATIKSFQEQGSKAFCRYPARLVLIQKRLNIFTDFSIKDCPDFDEWQGLIAAKGISLIFPASYLNNPASAFGHTFLRLDQDPTNPKTDYYSYSINFSAHTFGEPGLIYAFKGIFGFYNGYFKVVPYFELVKLYSDLEKRDIWEYRLNFKQEEIDFLVKHLWELRNINFNYYYFDENCSYHLLGLIDVLRPSLKLRDQFKTWAIPGDTLKAVGKDRKLVLEEKFRPSLSSKFNARQAESSLEIKKIAKDMIDSRKSDINHTSQFTLEQKAEIYDLAYDYLDYLIVGDKIPAKESDPLAFQLLNKRSALGVSSKELQVPLQSNPLYSHGSERIAYGGLYRDSHYYQSFDLRFAYHDLLDPQAGFVPGSQINFMDFQFLLDSQQEILLDRASLIELVSLTPGSYFLKPLSWSLTSGLQRENVPHLEREKLVYRNELFLGRSAKLNADNQIYLLAGISNKLNTSFDNNQATGAGTRLGWLGYRESFNYLTELNFRRYFFGDEHTSLGVSGKVNIPLTHDLNLRLEVAREKDYQDTFNSYRINFFYYF